MLQTPIADVDDVRRDVLALGIDYPYGTLLETHRHRRAQFLYGIRGIMEVETEEGKWLVLPYSGVWIPSQKAHLVRMLNVSTRSLYIEPAAAPRLTDRCEVLTVSPLLHQLLLSAANVPAEYDEQGRDGALMQLMLHELARAAALPFYTPLPRERLLARKCVDFMERPNIHSTADQWAAGLNKSLRTFSRYFYRETGMSFSQWRRHACLFYAISAMTRGESITEIALSLGYENVNAFSSMFRREYQCPPSAFMLQLREGGQPGIEPLSP